MGKPPDPGSQKPREPRWPVDWRVRLKYAEWQKTLRVVVLNASRGGLFIGTPNPAAPGTRVSVTLDLPDGSAVTMEGVVRHVVTPERAIAEGKPPGVGIEVDSRYGPQLALVEKTASDVAVAEAKASAPGVAPPATPPPVAAQPAPRLTPPSMEAQAPAAPKEPPWLKAPAARAVGIDFGTTYSSVSVAVGDKVHLLSDENGRFQLPSMVAFPENGKPVVGWPARLVAARQPHRAVVSAKRLLGRNHSEPCVATFRYSAAFKILEGPNDSVVVDMDGTTWAIPQICSLVFGQLRDLAARQLGRPVTEIVLSVPVSFGDKQRLALRLAAGMAKLNVVDMIDEPVAGAVAYGLGRGKNEIVGVYDFGGGTFDFSVLDVVGDRFRVLKSRGDDWLGGDDFDLALAQHAADAFWRETKVELRQRVVEWGRLVMACEAVKRRLSAVPSAKLRVESVVESPRRMDLNQTYDCGQVEQLCAGLVERSLSVCKETLDELGFEPSDVTQVVVLGGVSRIPFVMASVAKFFDREVKYLVKPEEAVALGAGLHAAIKTGHHVTGVVESSP